MFPINTENLTTLKHHIFFKKHYILLSFTLSVVMNIKTYLKNKFEKIKVFNGKIKRSWVNYFV